MNSPNSGILFSKAGEKAIPLTRIELLSEISDTCSNNIVRQYFKNDEECQVEAVYCFPLESTAVVNALRIKTADRIITASIEDKNKAFDIYDDSVMSSASSLLMDYEGRDVFLVSAGNLAPGCEAVVEIEYLKELDIRDNKVIMRIPSTIAPHYIGSEISPMEAEKSMPEYTEGTPYRMDFKIKINSSGIERIYSPSHEIEIEKNDDSAIVRLNADKCRMDSDFVLEITSDKLSRPLCVSSVDENGERSAFLRFRPEFSGGSAPQAKQNSDILFLIDASYSMSHACMNSVKDALETALGLMRQGDFFNIIKFGKESHVFYGESLAYNDDNRRKALKDIALMEAEMGGTELEKVISHACSIPVREGHKRDIVLFTDGAVHNTQDIIRNAAKMNRGAGRFYTFGIGGGASHFLIRGLADVSRGAWEMIGPGEDIRSKVLRQFSRISQEEVSNLKIIVENAELTVEDEVPPVYDGDSWSITAELHDFKTEAQISISGIAGSEKFFWTGRIEDRGMDKRIAILRAASKIRQLERKGNAENKIKKIALKHKIISTQTSFVAVSSNASGQGFGVAPQYRRIPLVLGRDYGEIISNAGSSYPVCEEAAAYVARRATGLDTKWYEKIINSQSAEGSFEDFSSMAERMGISSESLYKKLNMLAEKTFLNDKNDQFRIIMTALALRLILADMNAITASAGAVRKAEKWLEAKTKKAHELIHLDEMVDEILSIIN